MRNIEESKSYKKKIGIYYIILESDKRTYIGSSVDIGKRVRNHYTDLITSKHSNSYLQRTWNKGNADNFSFGIIEICDKDELLIREQHWIDFFKSYQRDVGFNLAPVAGSTLGTKRTEQQIINFQLAIQGKHDTNLTQEEASEIKSQINKGLLLKEIAENINTSYDNVRSIKRGSTFKYVNPQIDYENNMNAKLEIDDVIEIKKMINKNIKVKDIAFKYNVSHRTISAIKNEINWKDVGDRITAKKRKSKKKGVI